MFDKSRNQLIYIFIMIGITLSFSIFFSIAKSDPLLQEAIRENIEWVPIGQSLAYAAYLGTMLVISYQKFKHGDYNIKITRQNALQVGARIFGNMTSVYVDIISITVIVFGFFIVGFGLGGEAAVKAMFWSDLCFLTVLPYLAFFSNYCLRKKNN